MGFNLAISLSISAYKLITIRNVILASSLQKMNGMPYECANFDYFDWTFVVDLFTLTIMHGSSACGYRY